MALLSGKPRTATIQSAAPTDLLEIGKEDFDRLVAHDRQLATAVRRLSHERAISNLSSGGANPPCGSGSAGGINLPCLLPTFKNANGTGGSH
jgi:hypothetical protein